MSELFKLLQSAVRANKHRKNQYKSCVLTVFEDGRARVSSGGEVLVFAANETEVIEKLAEYLEIKL